MDIQNIKSYEEFANDHKKYSGYYQCFVHGCDKPGYYEGGDARFYCGMCEEHVGLKESYLVYLNHLERKIRIRMMWDKDDAGLEELINKIDKERNNVT